MDIPRRRRVKTMRSGVGGDPRAAEAPLATLLEDGAVTAQMEAGRRRPTPRHMNREARPTEELGTSRALIGEGRRSHIRHGAVGKKASRTAAIVVIGK